MHRVSLLLALLAALLLPGVGQAGAEWATTSEPAVLVDPPPVPAGWVTVAGLVLQVHAPPEEGPVAQRLARHGARSYRELGRTLGLPLGDVVHVLLTDSPRSFRQLQPGRPPHWADGTAWPVQGWVFLRAPHLRSGQATPLEQVLDHELVHVLLGRAFRHEPPPRWLDEGMARVWSGEHGPDNTHELGRALVGREPFTLAELTPSFSRSQSDARLAYAQSADFVSWLRVRYGDDALRVLVRELAAGRGVDGSIRVATGDWIEDVERAWRRETIPPLRVWVLGSQETVWFLMGVLAVFALLVARRRQLALRAKLAEQEAVERWWGPGRG